MKSRSSKYSDLTLEEREIIEKGIREGEIFSSIALRISRTTSCVWGDVSKNGGRENYSAHAAQVRTQQARKRFGPRNKIQLSMQQEQQIKEMAEYGYSIRNIVSAVGVSKWIVDQRIAQFRERKLLSSDPDFLSRIEALEEQVKILTETIGEMYDRNS